MMHGRWRVGWVAVGMLAFCQSACTSLVPLEAMDGASTLEGVEPGDRLSVLDSSGATTKLDVTAVGPGFVEGLSSNCKPVRIAAAEVREIRERRVVPGKTIALGAGVGFFLFMQSVMAAGYEWY
ncbi:MAG TPA: hypothetical protein VLI71_11205 [Gammaproteobacteria bacterium]|nr:hypothetical protein [Gammaproteobacteria bacterium]